MPVFTLGGASWRGVVRCVPESARVPNSVPGAALGRLRDLHWLGVSRVFFDRCRRLRTVSGAAEKQECVPGGVSNAHGPSR